MNNSRRLLERSIGFCSTRLVDESVDFADEFSAIEFVFTFSFESLLSRFVRDGLEPGSVSNPTKSTINKFYQIDV